MYNLPDDEGSDQASADDTASSSTGDDDDGGGGGAPADAGILVCDNAPVETGYSVASLDHSEQAVVAEHAFRLSTMNVVLETLKPLGLDALVVQVQNALHQEERRARGRAQTNPKVASALMQEREMELADYARRYSEVAYAQRQNQQRVRTIRQMREEQETLHQRRLDLQSASTVAESMTVLRSFETADLGHGHPGGGSADHIRNRMNVLDRVRARAAPLPPEQHNDWQWFRKRCDKTRVGLLPPAHRPVWAVTFKDIALRLLEKMENGDHNAVSRWMAEESRIHLGAAALRC